MNPFTGKRSKIGSSFLAFFLTSLLISSSIFTITPTLASSNVYGEQSQEEDNSNLEAHQDNENLQAEDTQNLKEQEDDNQEQEEEDIQDQDAQTKAPSLSSDDVDKPFDNPPESKTKSDSNEPTKTDITPIPDATVGTPPLTSKNPTLSEDCESKRGESYLPPGDPCIEPLLALCDDDTLDYMPGICLNNPRENPQGDRCINEAGQWTGNVRECFPSREDILREACGPQWDPGEECIIYGPEKTILYGPYKVVIGGQGVGGVACVRDPTGVCIEDAPNLQGGCYDKACEERQKAEQERREARFDEQEILQAYEPDRIDPSELLDPYPDDPVDPGNTEPYGPEDPGYYGPEEPGDDGGYEPNIQRADQGPLVGPGECDPYTFTGPGCYPDPDPGPGSGPCNPDTGEGCYEDPYYEPNIPRGTMGPLIPAGPCDGYDVTGCYDDIGGFGPDVPSDDPTAYETLGPQKPPWSDDVIDWVKHDVAHYFDHELPIEILYEFGLEAIKHGGVIPKVPAAPGFPAGPIGVALGIILTDGGLNDSTLRDYCREHPNAPTCQPPPPPPPPPPPAPTPQ